MRRRPWNPSPLIDKAGYCKGIYTQIPGDWEYGKDQRALGRAQIRQVPGHGNCLFHAISTCMAEVVYGSPLQYPEDLGWLYGHSAYLRQCDVDRLQQKRSLYLVGNTYLTTQDLVPPAAAKYSISAARYLDLMQQDGYWGGGPQIVALSNVLERPIHVYELASLSTSTGTLVTRSHWMLPFLCGDNASDCFVLKCIARFGSPKFDEKEPFLPTVDFQIFYQAKN
ncbi:OTU-like cysteine protease [Seminavis robusta]|uniref:OTU-like cysteine protease n=1 Tax=Seminavis robusta TaxID=568900 RepID=A0A9N8F3Z8_9STRA|nr:OTU-like cysteine protease [Seminavis robusta]|eukprot:Sro3424_g347860.1 OTU-like cysteine protease (224) ;mRNA; f:3356-4027